MDHEDERVARRRGARRGARVNLGWMFVAFLVVWVGIGIYLLSLGRRQKRLEHRIDELRAPRS